MTCPVEFSIKQCAFTMAWARRQRSPQISIGMLRSFFVYGATNGRFALKCSRKTNTQVVTAGVLALALVFCSLGIDGVPTAARTRVFAIRRGLHESTSLPQRVTLKRQMADGGQRNHFGGARQFPPLQSSFPHALSTSAVPERLPRQSPATFLRTGFSLPDRAPPRIL